MASQLCTVAKGHKEDILCVAWTQHSDEKKLFVTGSMDLCAKVWRLVDKETGADSEENERLETVTTYVDHPAPVLAIATNPSNPLMATSCMDCRIRIWDLEKKSQEKVLDAGPGECWDLSFHPKGEELATGSFGGDIIIWSVKSGNIRTTLMGKGEFAFSVRYNVDGSLLAVGDKIGRVIIWDMTDEAKEPIVATVHTMPVRSLCFSADNSMVVSGSDDMTINLYNASDGSLVGSMRGHSAWIWSVSCSSDGRYVASASSDKKVNLWDIKKRTLVQKFEGHTDQVHGVAFNGDGTRLVSVGAGGDIFVYSIAP